MEGSDYMAKQANNTGVNLGFESQLWAVAQLRKQQAEGGELDAAIATNVKALGFWGPVE